MNVFIFDLDLETNAQMHCDRHVVKMILEAAQLGCAVHHLTGGTAQYKLTHANHPLTQWAKSSVKAYRYVVNYGLALCKEYTYRYGKVHKSQAVLLWLKKHEPDLPNTPVRFRIVVKPDCIIPDSAVESYRQYMRVHKRAIATWTKRPVPDWYS